MARRKRRKWSDEEKISICLQTNAPGVSVSQVGDQSGVYKALEDIGPCNHTDLATKSGIDERYLREWLSANAAAGYVNYDASDLPPENQAI